MVVLRTYTHTAQREHWCDNCCNYIVPGQQYEGIVETTGKGIIVWKKHVNPECEFPPDPEDELVLVKRDKKPSGLVKKIDSVPLPKVA